MSNLRRRSRHEVPTVEPFWGYKAVFTEGSKFMHRSFTLIIDFKSTFETYTLFSIFLIIFWHLLSHHHFSKLIEFNFLHKSFDGENTLMLNVHEIFKFLQKLESSWVKWEFFKNSFLHS